MENARYLSRNHSSVATALIDELEETAEAAPFTISGPSAEF
jgi:hypothetical protein